MHICNSLPLTSLRNRGGANLLGGGIVSECLDSMELGMEKQASNIISFFIQSMQEPMPFL